MVGLLSAIGELPQTADSGPIGYDSKRACRRHRAKIESEREKMEIASPLLIGWILLVVHSSGAFAASGLAQLRDFTEAQNEPRRQTQFEDCSAFGVNSGSPHMVSELGTVTAVVGDIVVFRCQSEPGSHQCNSSDRHFAINGSVIEDGVIRMDANVAVLHMCLSAETNGTYIDCNCQKGNATTKLDMVYVVAAKRHTAESTNITCLLDGGESLWCHWDYVYNSYPPQFEVNWTATYYVENAEDDLHGPCVMANSRRATSCTITEVQMLSVYVLNVTGVGALGEIHLTSRFSARLEMLRLPPVRINRVSTTSTSIEMEFQPPTGELGSYLSFLFTKQEFECEAMVYDGLSGTAIKDELFILNASLLARDPEVSGEATPFVANITGLLPFQLHRVRVRCRVARIGQFWSESVYENAETKEAAPSVGPAVFKTSGYSPSRRLCTNGWYGYIIYWQGIRQARGTSNGLVAYYTVQLHTDDDSRHSLPRSTSLARVGPHERQAWICLRGDTRHIVTVHAATGAGVGPAAGALVIPPRSKVDELAVKPCRIFVRRGNNTDVRVFLTAAFNSTVVGDVDARIAKERSEERSRSKEEDEAETTPNKGDGGDFKESSFWTVAWCQQADENCKGDIEHRRIAAGSMSIEVKVNGSALDYAFGVAQTIDDQSGGITWAECSHDTLAGPSEIDRPEATVKSDGVRVSIKRSYCSLHATPEEPRVLHYCPVQEKRTRSDCKDLTDSKESATKLNISTCCQGRVMRRVLDSCEDSVILPLIDDETTDYIVWLSYDSAAWSHLSSSAVLATWAEGGNWTVEIICTVVVCAAVAGSILIVIAYRKLRPNMKLGKIYRVPPQRELHGASTTLFEEGTEKSKEYFPMIHWQARVNWALNGTEIREKQHSPSFSEESGDSGLSSVKSRGPAQSADDREATAENRGGAESGEEWHRCRGLLPSSSSSFSGEDYDDVVESRDLVACGSGCRPAVMKPGFRNAGYQPDDAVDAYFRTLPSVTEKEIAEDLFEPECDIELAKSPKLVAAKMLITPCSIDSAHRKTDQLICGKTDRAADNSGQKESERVANAPTREAAEQPDAGSSAVCDKTCNGSCKCSCASRSGESSSSSSMSPECRPSVAVIVSGVLPMIDDDYCYAGNKPQRSSVNALDDLSDSAGSSSSCYVKCAAHDDDGYDDAVIGYDDDDVGDEPAVVDISQFF